MNKIVKISLIGVVVGVMLAGGFYWNYIQNSQDQEQKDVEIMGNPSDYTVTEPELEESDQARYVENKKAGLKVRIPDNYTEEKMDVMEGSMVFYSPDMESMRKNSTSVPLKKGCMIEVAVGYEKIDFDQLRKEIEENQKSLIMQSENKFEMIEVNGIPALKNTFDCMDLGYSIETYILTEEILYGLRTSSGPEDIEKCSQEFNKFLESVVID